MDERRSGYSLKAPGYSGSPRHLPGRDGPLPGLNDRLVEAEVTRDDLFSWLDGWNESEAVETAFDPVAIRSASEQRIEEQNEIGRQLAERFLAEAARI